jgi:hypothetical protein
VLGEKLFFSVVASAPSRGARILSESLMNMMALTLASGIDAQRILVFHQDKVTVLVSSFVGFHTDTSSKSRIAQNLHISVLYDTCRKVEVDDNVEGASVCTYSL